MSKPLKWYIDHVISKEYSYSSNNVFIRFEDAGFFFCFREEERKNLERESSDKWNIRIRCKFYSEDRRIWMFWIFESGSPPNLLGRSRIRLEHSQSISEFTRGVRWKVYLVHSFRVLYFWQHFWEIQRVLHSFQRVSHWVREQCR